MSIVELVRKFVEEEKETNVPKETESYQQRRIQLSLVQNFRTVRQLDDAIVRLCTLHDYVRALLDVPNESVLRPVVEAAIEHARREAEEILRLHRDRIRIYLEQYTATYTSNPTIFTSRMEVDRWYVAQHLFNTEYAAKAA